MNSGLAFHLHHDSLIEYCSDYAGRVAFIKGNKPAHEIELRLRLFKLIPADRVPASLLEGLVAYEKAWAARVKAWDAYEKAKAAFEKKFHEAMPELEIIHKELCPGCPYDGQTIFAGERFHIPLSRGRAGLALSLR